MQKFSDLVFSPFGLMKLTGTKKSSYMYYIILYYNVYEISSSARGEFQSKTNVFHRFTTVQYS